MKDKLLQILEEDCPGVDFAEETALVDDGVIESLDMVTIVADIMDAFGITITVDDLLPENFNTVDAMLDLIERKQNG
ncbi:MAG: acyl carrier protein [Firmicutes bacterium]|jgi:acyl carrier protein|nr:acyl carrier protein [Bacillota bacterium]